MVAGGQGGGAFGYKGSVAGGKEGGKPIYWTDKFGDKVYNSAATQSSGNGFGQGQDGRNGMVGVRHGEGSGGGGGGLYGGYAPQDNGNCTVGGGGSGYVNEKLLNVDAKTIAGNQSFLSPSGVSETGHAGNGAALITWLP